MPAAIEGIQRGVILDGHLLPDRVFTSSLAASAERRLPVLEVRRQRGRPPTSGRSGRPLDKVGWWAKAMCIVRRNAPG